MNSDQKIKNKRTWTILLWSLCTITVILGSGYIYFISSPVAGAWFIRRAFEKDGEKVNLALARYVPAAVSSILDEHYATEDEDAFLDVYYPQTAQNGNPLPTVVWAHGGGWVAGNKEQTANYGKILAGKGFTVVVVDYTLAPKKHYPYQIGQINQALAYITKYARRLHVNPRLLFLAGDSGGASMVAQYANLLTEPAYAALMGIRPLIEKEQLAGVLLYCGPYDVGMVNLEGNFGWFINTICWAYSGKKDFMSVPELKTLSVLNFVTRDFPPAYISVGNADPLAPQSVALANKLLGLGVAVDTLFFPAASKPELPHEYQFNLDTDAGKQALDHSVAFVQQIAAGIRP